MVKRRKDSKNRVLKTGESERAVFSSGDFWSVQPYIGHDFYFLENTVHIAMYDLGVELPDGTRDIIELGEK